ncbi:MAG: hypothetical protein AB199_03600 [Parcubacteria bacterium C7867-004]|nr:MAG: hypothetical protein AB199_03600 [Parcubacteria bacterium C7867-004]
MSKRKKEARKLWFRAKEYGWGWYPASWQGWTITFLYTLLFAVSIIFFVVWVGAANEAHSGFRNVVLGIFEFVAWMTFLVYSMLRICYKTGEEPHWSWGHKEKK